MGEDGHAIALAPPADDLLLRGLVLLAQFHGIAADASQLSHDNGRKDEGFDEHTLLLAARQLGLKSRFSTHPPARIGKANLPALAVGAEGHPPFVVALKAASRLNA